MISTLVSLSLVIIAEIISIVTLVVNNTFHFELLFLDTVSLMKAGVDRNDAY